jgi:microcystin-dependent protein
MSNNNPSAENLPEETGDLSRRRFLANAGLTTLGLALAPQIALAGPARASGADPIIGSVMIFAGTFAPANYALCNGFLESIANNNALFALLGTTYGGDGITTFAYPDLRGRIPMHQGTGAGLPARVIGETGGTESVALTANQMPTHTHTLLAVTNTNAPSGARTEDPTDAYFSFTGGLDREFNPVANATANAGILNTAGGSLPHENMPPFLCLTFAIATAGIFPSRN